MQKLSVWVALMLIILTSIYLQNINSISHSEQASKPFARTFPHFDLTVPDVESRKDLSQNPWLL